MTSWLKWLFGLMAGLALLLAAFSFGLKWQEERAKEYARQQSIQTVKAVLLRVHVSLEQGVTWTELSSLFIDMETALQMNAGSLDNCKAQIVDLRTYKLAAEYFRPLTRRFPKGDPYVGNELPDGYIEFAEVVGTSPQHGFNSDGETAWTGPYHYYQLALNKLDDAAQAIITSLSR